jgi:hypothetical protein
MTSALPARLTDVIGRRRDRDEVIGLLEGARCLTLTGSGGCGKTTLALEVATAWARGRSERAIWVDLAATDDPAQVAPRLAGALGIRERSGEDLGDRLAHELAGRSMLIVMDNCEHLLAACAELLTRLLRSSTRTRVLATSREPLLVPGEVTYRVPSLEVPDEDGERADRGGCCRGRAAVPGQGERGTARLRAQRRQRRRGGGHLPAPRRHPPRHRARRGPPATPRPPARSPTGSRTGSGCSPLVPEPPDRVSRRWRPRSSGATTC